MKIGTPEIVVTVMTAIFIAMLSAMIYIGWW